MPSFRFPKLVPNQDGAGTIEAVGDGVATSRVGERVWLWEAAWQRADGTAQELVVIPSRQAVHARCSLDGCWSEPRNPRSDRTPLPHGLGARPAEARTRSAPWSDRVGGGRRGAVGHAAIQLARWAGARVISTVSSDEKAGLALSAGAEHAVNYRAGEAADEIRRSYPTAST